MLEALRTAVERRMVADVPVGVLLSGGLDSSLIVALLAESGPAGLETFSVGFDDVGGDVRATSSATPTWSPQTSAPTITRSTSPPIGCCRRSTARSRAMSEPMVSHDAVAFYLLSEEVSRSLKVVQSGPGRRRGVRRLLLVSAAASSPDGDGAEAYRAAVL